MSPRGYVQEQKFLITYHSITLDDYSASGDLNAATGFVNNDEPDVDGWDVQLDVDLKLADVVVGYADREIGFEAEAIEYFGGLKWWFGQPSGQTAAHRLAELRDRRVGDAVERPVPQGAALDDPLAAQHREVA